MCYIIELEVRLYTARSGRHAYSQQEVKKGHTEKKNIAQHLRLTACGTISNILSKTIAKGTAPTSHLRQTCTCSTIDLVKQVSAFMVRSSNAGMHSTAEPVHNPSSNLLQE